MLFAFVKSKSTEPGVTVIVDSTKPEDAASPKVSVPEPSVLST